MSENRVWYFRSGGAKGSDEFHGVCRVYVCQAEQSRIYVVKDLWGQHEEGGIQMDSEGSQG